MTTEVTPNPQDTRETQDKQDKQITVAVPEDRVGEFYVWYGRFLAGRSGRRHGRGPRGRHGRRCGEHATTAATETPTTTL
jgi:hypothetical protein